MFDHQHEFHVQLHDLSYRYEKAGITLAEQPIPWNAESVLVDATIRCPKPIPPHGLLCLRMSGHDHRVTPETVQQIGMGGYQATFRLNVPASSVNAEIVYGQRSLGQMTLPLLREDAFFQNLQLNMPTLSVQLGSYSVACQTYISSQCNGVSASVMLKNLTALSPLADMDFRIEFQQETGETMQVVPLRLSSSQLQSKQAMVTAFLRKPRRIGRWRATWYVDDRELAVQRINAIARSRFFKSLYVAETRFVLQQRDGGMRIVRHLTDETGYIRAGPCFLLQSREAGMAAICSVQIRAKIDGAMSSPLLSDQETLLTDGPLPVAPGTLERSDLDQLTAFELWLNDEPMGTLHKSPAPPAKFTTEGSFADTPEFMWTTTADAILEERLRDLMGDH